MDCQVMRQNAARRRLDSPRGPADNHQKWSYDFNEEWRKFFKAHPEATREEILSKMYKMREKYK